MDRMRIAATMIFYGYKNTALSWKTVTTAGETITFSLLRTCYENGSLPASISPAIKADAYNRCNLLWNTGNTIADHKHILMRYPTLQLYYIFGETIP